jgi:hypothetical protein
MCYKSAEFLRNHDIFRNTPNVKVEPAEEPEIVPGETNGIKTNF